MPCIHAFELDIRLFLLDIQNEHLVNYGSIAPYMTELQSIFVVKYLLGLEMFYEPDDHSGF